MSMASTLSSKPAQVWQRTPPGTTVRNLWGVVEGGLVTGQGGLGAVRPESLGINT